MGRVSEAAEALKTFELPARLNEVLKESRFWTEACLRVYLDLCDEALFEDPGRGLEMAKAAPTLATRVSKVSRAVRLSLQLRSQAVLGSAYRATGLLREADKVYDSAFDLAYEFNIASYEMADLYCRQAVLRVEQKRLEAALECASTAVEIYRMESRARDPERSLGAALLARGVVHLQGSRIGLFNLSDALRDFSEALSCCHPKRAPRIFLTASHNLAVAILEGAHRPDDLQTALRHVEQSQKLLRRFRIRRKTVADAKLRWLRGLILMRFGSTQRAEQLLVGARHDLMELGAAIETALISLDLGELYLLEGRWGTLRITAEEVFGMQTESYSHEILSALLLWQRAIREQNLTTEIIAFARRKIDVGGYFLSGPTEA